MRPGHLNVFDGLRITTEHMNYLQGSFHSAVEDLRGILGLGVVYSGLDVTVAGSTVTVGPGLAFDFQGNRIVLDQEVQIELSFAADENTKYVCVKYDQIEDGEIEGRFTLVWDSGAVELRSTLPEEADNVVPIARVVRVEGNGAVRVEEIGSVDSPKSPPNGVAPAPASTPATSTPASLAVHQDVARLSNTAKAQSVDLDFEILSLTCHTILNGKTATDNYSSTSQGEATFSADGVAQFGVAYSKLVEDGVACLPVALVNDAELLVKVKRNDGKGFVVSCDWRSDATAEEIKKIEDQGSAFEWEALVAWKALGESRG